MVSVIACLLGLLILLIAAEYIGKRKILRGEYHRKFLHITAGAFIAFWPWLISWHWIQLISLAMVAGMMANHHFNFLNYHGKVGRATYGDIFYALAIFLSAAFTHNKYFFMLAIMEVAIADGFAAVFGMAFGRNWSYRIFGNRKTIIGSMVFWIATVAVFGIGLLSAHDFIMFSDYVWIIILLPPFFTAVENFSVFGLDNLVIALLTVLILSAVSV